MAWLLFVLVLSIFVGLVVESMIVTDIDDVITPASGTYTFLEELRSEIRHVIRTTQFYEPVQLFKYDNDPCNYPERIGLEEFSDWGPNPVNWFRSKYIRSPAHKDVDGIAHFSFLDAYGARLVNGELQVVVNADPEAPVGFITFDGKTTESLSMYYEPASFGAGLGDSAALAPPLRLRAMSVKEFLAEAQGGECFCDQVLDGEVYAVLGLLYYPQYGHSLYNGFSNFLATLWRKGLGTPRKDGSRVVLLHHLLRNTTSFAPGVEHMYYSIQWHDWIDNLFKGLVDATYSWSNEILQVSELNPTAKICFRRILVGAAPDLDHLNDTATSHLWDTFSRTLISLSFSTDFAHFLGRPFDAKVEVIAKDDLLRFDPVQRRGGTIADSPPPHQASDLYPKDCAVTFIVRDNGYARRDIANIEELSTAAVAAGCAVQCVRMHELSLRDQIEVVRWNTSLLVATDGTGLLNAVHMRPCSTVLRVLMWRKAALVARLGPVQWLDFRPSFNESRFIAPHERIASYLLKQAAQGMDMDSIDLTNTPFPGHDLENFLRNDQTTFVNVHEFLKVVELSRKRISGTGHYNDCKP